MEIRAYSGIFGSAVFGNPVRLEETKPNDNKNATSKVKGRRGQSSRLDIGVHKKVSTEKERCTKIRNNIERFGSYLVG